MSYSPRADGLFNVTLDTGDTVPMDLTEDELKAMGHKPAALSRPGSGFRWATPSPAEAVAAGDTGKPVPERFQTFPVQNVSPSAAAARSFTSSALDAAAFPIKAIGSAAEALGYPNAAANLSGEDAAESAEWLLNRKEPRDIRREQNSARTSEIAPAVKAGELAGEFVGGAALNALTGRVPALGTVRGLTKKEIEHSERVTASQQGRRISPDEQHANLPRDLVDAAQDSPNDPLWTRAIPQKKFDDIYGELGNRIERLEASAEYGELPKLEQRHVDELRRAHDTFGELQNGYSDKLPSEANAEKLIARTRSQLRKIGQDDLASELGAEK